MTGKRTNDIPLTLAQRHIDKQPELAADIEKLFDRLCLPVPSDNEFLTRRHKDFMLPITRYGVMLQISQKPMKPIPNHPLILQPLGEFHSEHWHVRIMPGVHLRATDEEVTELTHKLARDGINFHDNVTHNAGNLPLATAEHPDGIPVVIDTGAARELPSYTPPAMNTSTDPQHRLYKDLREKLAQAFATPSPDAIRGQMREFWQLCEQKRSPKDGSEPTLIAGWNEVNKSYAGDSRTYDIKEFSRAYSVSLGTYLRQTHREIEKNNKPSSSPAI